MKTTRLGMLTATIAACCATAWGQAQPWPEAVRQAGDEQEALRVSAVKIQDDLAALKAAMKEFIPDEVAVVDRPTSQIEALARSDLQQAETYLQAAEGESNAVRRAQLLQAARSSQAVIEQRLQDIWRQLGAPLAAADLLKTVRETARQQSVAQSEARRLAARPDADEEVRKRQQALQREQERLAQVAGQINDQLEKLNPAWTNRQLEADARAAAQALKAGDHAQAQAEQAQTLASLQALMKGLNPQAGKPDLDRLQYLRRDLDVLANMQNSADVQRERGRTKEALAELERAASLAAAMTPAASELSPASAERLKETSARTEAMANALAAAAHRGQPVPPQFAEAAKAAAAATENARKELEQTMARLAPPAGSKSLGKSATAMGTPAPGGSNQGESAGNTPSSQRTASEGPSRQAQGGGLGESEGEVASSGGEIKNAQSATGLNPREREAAAQLQSVHPPAEFAPEVGQYFKNLAEGVTPGESN